MLSKNHIFYLFTVFFVGLSIAVFPSVSQNQLTFAQMNQDKDATMEKYKNEWDSETIRRASANTTKYQYGEIVATITIPMMDLYEQPIYYGADPVYNDWKITTPGHAGNYAMFGESGVSGVGAHNYQLFRSLPDLKIGDKLIIETDIDRYVYVVYGIDIYDDTKDSWSEKATAHINDYGLTLMTCYPINATKTNDMYLVYASLQKGTTFDLADS